MRSHLARRGDDRGRRVLVHGGGGRVTVDDADVCPGDNERRLRPKPQHTEPALVGSGWKPEVIDYLYVSFTNAAAFSPTDTMPLSRWAKMLMLVQSAISLALP